MGLSFDFYNRLKQSKMFLANPQKTYIGTVKNAQNIKLKQILTNLYELEFVIYEKLNGEYTENYDKYTKPRLIEVQNVGWFQIVDAPEKSDDSTSGTYKTIKCYMLENTLIYRKIYDIVGTFALYDVTDQAHSLLHIIANEVKWGIGHVSNSLLGLFRTFDINSMEIYNLLTTKISESFGCLIIFDSYNKLINAYTLDEIGEDTNIIISRNNILREWEKNDSDSIITKLSVYGGDDGNGGTVDIRAVNFGLNYLVNFDYFLSEEWVSTGLINGYNNYKTALNTTQTSYNTNIENLKIKQSELTTLKAELNDLSTHLIEQSQVMGNSIQLHGRTPISSDSDYTIYQNAVSLCNTYTSQVSTKNSEISSKQAEIMTIEDTLNSISDAINIENYLTTDQLSELDLFIVEGDDFSDETYVQVDTMTPQEVIDMKLELKQNAVNELAKISQPRYTITINASNLYTIQDDKDALIPYEDWIEKFQLGNKILVKLRDNYSIIARLVSISIDFDNPSDIELTFTNKDRLEDSLIELAELISNAGRTANAYTLKSFGYNKASKQTSTVREFMNNSLNATTNRVISDSHIQTELGEFGIINRKWLEDQNKYDDHQSWLTQNILLFTDDNWVTSKSGIGYFTNSNNETFYGVLSDIICGDLVMSSKLRVTNSSGTYTITDETGLLAENGIYSVMINPNSPNQIFNISVNGVNKLYFDTMVSKLVVDGVINAESGTLGNLTVLGKLTGGEFEGATIIGSKFITSASQLLTKIEDGMIGTTSLRVYGSYDSLTNNFNTSGSRTIIAGGNISIANESATNFSVDSSGLLTTSDIVCNSLIINGATPITSLNYNSGSFLFPPAPHPHTEYASSSHSHSISDISGLYSTLSDLDGRITALGG